MHDPSTRAAPELGAHAQADLHAALAICHVGLGPAAWLLVARRNPGKPFAGLWEWPGGRVEPGETAADAVRRELAEETGLRAPPEAVSLLCRHRAAGPPSIEFHVHLVAFREPAPPLPLQCSEVAWLPAELALAREFPPANGEINRRVRAWLGE